MFRFFGFVLSFFFFISATTPHHLYFKKTFKTTLPQHARPLIILDAGHGGTDEGAKVSSLVEKRVTLQTVLILKKMLEEVGCRVILTRSRDVYVPLHRRVSIANKTRASLFVSVHYNSSPSPDAEGLEVFYYAGQDPVRVQASKNLASAVLTQIQQATKAVSRGVKVGNFHVIRETTMPAILVEGGFMTHRDEVARLKDKSYLEKIAKGIALGVERYLKQKKIALGKPEGKQRPRRELNARPAA